MTWDTFVSLKVGARLKPMGRKRTYPVVRVVRNLTRRVVYVCLNSTAVEMGKESAREFGIFAADDLDHKSHYINWERISSSVPSGTQTARDSVIEDSGPRN